MPDALKLGFGPFAAPAKGVLIVFCDDGLKFGPATAKALGRAADLVTRAAKAERFTGKSGTALELVAPAGLKAARLVVVGAGKAAELKPQDFVKLGGVAMGKVPASASEATMFAELPGGALSAAQAADLALGMRLRAYAFDRYKTKRKEGEEPPASPQRHHRGRRCRRGAQGLTARARPSPTAWSWRAISSTSRPTCSIRKNSPAAPAR